ncbi:MAG: zinc ribbon domain-containing protein [Ruminococcaceae bacterium]|jgi:flagellar basal body-associated protein FliL|nr:zinc ribbon domain-containing protein [Oscillospiraceae bacterium]
MFCSKCGSQIPEGGKFCPKCGNPVNPAAQAVQPQTVNNQYLNYTPVQNKKSKKSGKKTALIVLGIIAAVIIALALAIAVFWQGIARAVLGEAGFYAWREYKTLNKILTVNDFEKLGENERLTAKAVITGESGDLAYQKILEKLSAHVDLSYDSEEEKGYSAVSIYSDEKEEATANISFDDDKIGIIVPQLTDKKFYADLDSGENDVEIDLTPVIDEFTNIISQLDLSGLKAKTEVDKKVIDLKEYRNVTFTLNGEEASGLLVDLLTAVKNDEALFDALDPVFKEAYENSSRFGLNNVQDYGEYKEKIIAGIDKAIKEIESTFGDEDITLVFSFAADKRGYIVYRELTLSSGERCVVNISADSRIRGKENFITVQSYIDWTETLISVGKSQDRNGASFRIRFRSVETYSDGAEGDGFGFIAELNRLKVRKINGVNVLVGAIDVNTYDVVNGKNSDTGARISVNLENNKNYEISASVSVGSVSHNLNINFTELYNEANFESFIEPDENGTDDFDEFSESVLEGFERKAEEVIGEIAPDLLLQFSKSAQLKDCQQREKLIEENLVKYLKTGNKGKPFKNAKDAVDKQNAFNNMFEEGHPPYCICGDPGGTKYEIYVYDDLSYSIKCQNPECPNYGE